ncbi:hypothetical protein ACIQYG_01970 [Peribacillus sp. NPDC096622]|uniref:hypothetical protein n=1 Tax=Peribacillus sp. NPDC096622 TaxID=3364396 RepID=UPI0038150E62
MRGKNEKAYCYAYSYKPDGYIAREDGSIDWLEETEGEGTLDTVYNSIDTVIMGNKTYQ